MCLDISGIPGDTGNPQENVESKLIEHARKVNIELSAGDIDKCHRKGKPRGEYNRKVIIKFANSKARQRVYEGRKRIGDGIFVTENLTRLREHLAYEARQLVRGKKLTRTWVAGCRVHVILPGETRSRVIVDLNAIDCIRQGNPLPQESFGGY